ncbi:MAG: helicase-exonuclease AddAB subunit AddA [Bacillota bacterium]|nr:helicase-exonuclease AddAB subunit AddA [Bacillota bacterium]
MGVKWTDEQSKAISDRGRTLLVSAAAGSGKTAVLVERIIRRVTDEKDPANIDDFLIVTFTNAAASEMREKISTAIYEKIAQRPSDRHLQNQLIRIGRAHIDTVHGFCIDVIKKNFQRLNLPPKYRVGDENEIGLISNEIMEDVLEEWYQKNGEDSDFAKAVDLFSGTKHDNGFVDTLWKVRKAIESLPEPLDALEGYCIDLERYALCEPLSTPHGKAVMDYAKQALSYALSLCGHLTATLPDAGAIYKDLLSCDSEKLSDLYNALQSGLSYDKAAAAFTAFGFDSLPRKKGIDENAKEYVKNGREIYKKIIKEVTELFSFKAEEIKNDFSDMHAAAKVIFGILSDFKARFSKAKLEKGLLDFSDMEHFALRLLAVKTENGYEKTDIAKEMSKKFEEIFVDEYQDTNEIQDVIFRAVSRGEGNLFMVGDVKQSIYRFRQACPEIFMQKKDLYPDMDGTDNDRAKLSLAANFRSRKCIIDAANFIFKTTMSRTLGEVDYDAVESLRFGAAYYDCKDDMPVEVDILDCEEEGGDSSSDERFEKECAHITARIQRLIQSGTKVYDKNTGELRPAGYRDIVILMRSLSSRCAVLERVLGEHGIPTYSDTASVFFRRSEVSVMLSLLQVIDNPLQDTHLISVMRSPIFCFTPDELARIRLCDMDAPFYDTVVKAAENGDGHCQSFIDKLEQYRIYAGSMGVDRLIYYIYEDTGFLNAVGALTDGELKRANLRLLYDYAQRFEETEFKGIFNFNSYIERVKQAEADIPSVKAFSENSDVVRIMTFHKSKGLEFPIVFLADTSHGFNKMDLNNFMIIDKTLGLSFKLRDLDRMVEFDTFARRAAKLKNEAEMLSEELRTLYVAMTRAKERLIITMTAPPRANLFNYSPEANGAVLPFHLRKCGSHGHWIISALMHHPCGKVLCDAGGALYEPVTDDSLFTVRITKPETPENVKTKTFEKAEYDAYALEDEIKQRLDFVYPYEAEAHTTTKLTVTKIKKLIEMTEEEDVESSVTPMPREIAFERPRFITEARKLTAAERGTALHSVMQYADYSRFSDAKSVKEELSRLYMGQYITEEQKEAVDIGVIMSFAESGFGKRLMKSGRLFREKKFSILMPVSELKPITGEDIAEPIDESIILQGVIDCVFEENGKQILVDFKTDFAKTEAEFIDKYRVQLELYDYALKETTGRGADEKYIYSFYLGKEIRL